MSSIYNNLIVIFLASMHDNNIPEMRENRQFIQAINISSINFILYKGMGFCKVIVSSISLHQTFLNPKDRGKPWHSGSALDSMSAGQVIDPASGA